MSDHDSEDVTPAETRVLDMVIKDIIENDQCAGCEYGRFKSAMDPDGDERSLPNVPHDIACPVLALLHERGRCWCCGRTMVVIGGDGTYCSCDDRAKQEMEPR